MPPLLVLGALGAWLGLSLVAQFRPFRGGPFLLRYLVPRWGLFTVVPAFMSVTACYRLERVAGDLGEWRGLPPPGRWPWYVSLWNPARRLGKIHCDLALALCEQRLTSPRENAPFSPAYRVLLDQALAAAPPGTGGRVQFCLRTESPEWPAERSRVLFMSDLHATR